MVTLSPRSPSSRPSDAAAIPFPRELTTPPVTKMYFVELTDSPPSFGEKTPLPPTKGLQAYRCLALPDRQTASRPSESRATAAAAARAVPIVLRERADRKSTRLNSS